MAATTRASSGKSAAKPAPAASTTITATKRKATTAAVKETPAKKVAIAATKKEAKTAPASKKAATTTKDTKETAQEKKVAEKKTVEKKPVEKKVVEKKVVEKKVVEKKTPASKKAAPAAAKPKATKAPVEEKEEEENEDDEEELMDDKELLKDIDSSADEDSDDETEEDRAAMKEDTFATMKDEILLSAKDAAIVKKKLGALGEAKDKSKTGVCYIGRIPHGFYEEQMKAYFSQFGKVLRLRLSRNKKTGKSKHYAFIEFASQEVAEIVADTMDNYLLFGHQLKCKALQPSQVHPSLFHGANKKFKAVPWLKIAKEKHNAEKSASRVNQVKKKLLKNEDAKRAKLAELGIDYEFPGYKASAPEKSKHIKF